VSYQVDNVNLKFAQLDELEKNGWVLQEVVPKKKPLKVCILHLVCVRAICNNSKINNFTENS